MFGAGNSRLVTGAAFTDSALLADQKLSDYKILHFATHGLVTAPLPDCPARPALVTGDLTRGDFKLCTCGAKGTVGLRT